MEISTVKAVETSMNYATAKISDSSHSNSSEIKKNIQSESDEANNQNASPLKGKKELSKDELQNVNSELNKFMSLINADIQFAMHEKTKQLMVQVVDTKDNKVIKEFPSHEMLDVIANIRDYVGVLLDKRA